MLALLASPSPWTKGGLSESEARALEVSASEVDTAPTLDPSPWTRGGACKKLADSFAHCGRKTRSASVILTSPQARSGRSFAMLRMTLTGLAHSRSAPCPWSGRGN